MPFEKSEVGEEVFVTSSGDRVQIDQSKIRAVPDGSRRLDWSYFRNQPAIEDTGAQRQPATKFPTSNDERLEMDTPEYAERFCGKGITPHFVKIVNTGKGNQTACITVRPASWDATDPLEIRDSELYGDALRARHAGLPFDAEVIRIHQSPEFRDPAFRAAYFAAKRKN